MYKKGNVREGYYIIYIDIMNLYKYLLNIYIGIIYSLNKYCMLGIVLGARDIAVNSKDKNPCHHGVSSF